MPQPSTLPAESLFKGFIRAYHVGTHTADVQLAASPRETIPAVRVATHIHAADAVVDRECTVLFFGAANCQDALVIGVQGALPSGGGGGVTDHGALTGLGDDDHAQYALLAGRAGGQWLIGGTASGGNLTLQSTAHATRGRVYVVDDLQLLADNLRGSDGTNRVQLAPASPHILLTGNPRIDGYLAIATPPDPTILLKAAKTEAALGALYGAYLLPIVQTSGGICVGIGGLATDSGAAVGDRAYTRGLLFAARHSAVDTIQAVQGGYLSAETISGAGNVTVSVAGLYVFAGLAANVNVAQSDGIWIRNFGKALVVTACGLRIDDQTAAGTNYILTLGPATPYMRLLGGADPAANQTNLYLKEGTNLRHVRVYDDGTRKYLILV